MVYSSAKILKMRKSLEFGVGKLILVSRVGSWELRTHVSMYRAAMSLLP